MHGLEEQVGRTMGARKGEAEVADTGGCAADHLECSGGTLRHHLTLFGERFAVRRSRKSRGS